MVGVAQLVRVPDCDSGCRGFESHRPPQFLVYNLHTAVGGVQDLFKVESLAMVVIQSTALGSLAQLVEQRTLNPRVEGSTPSRPTKHETPGCIYAPGVFLCVS